VNPASWIAIGIAIFSSFFVLIVAGMLNPRKDK
jgi:hypothetical protein